MPFYSAGRKISSVLTILTFERPMSSQSNDTKILTPCYGPLDLAPTLYKKPHCLLHTLSNNAQHIQHFFFSEHAKFIQIQVFVCYSWCLECDFLSPNHWELNSKYLFFEMFALATLAKVYYSSTLVIKCTYFLYTIYVYLKLCIFSVIYLCNSLHLQKYKTPWDQRLSVFPACRTVLCT